MSRERVVFCDFDGTITTIETFAGMLHEFTPSLAAVIMPQMYARNLTLRQGVRQLLESIPSRYYPDILRYCDDKPIRPGLSDLLNFLEEQKVEFHVVSGGLRGMVERVLSREIPGEQPIIKRVASIEAIEVDTREALLRVPLQPFEANTELVAKVEVMARYPAQEQVAIGDSLTDINMALQADVVFARKHLIGYLEAENHPYLPWDTFWDVRDRLQERWGVGKR